MTQTRQAISNSSDKLSAKVDAITGDRFAAEVADKVGKLVKGPMIDAVREETKRT